ncbi:hypothetical protein WP12_17250 [Sphingomonas sp. SRS2]|nr:hypothetical protein WP12_17250 [Sphingomonas sp. SRS2]
MKVVSALSELADVYIFGGLLRDLALEGVASFESDVDIVIRPFDVQIFQKWAMESGFKLNKFGGFRLVRDRWLFDVWELDRTWAFLQDTSIPRTKYTLIDTTFFNWDAIVYDIRANQIIVGQSYFENISQLRLEINFEPNPNPLGALVRCLKTLKNYRAKTGPRLTEFVNTNISIFSDIDILEYDRNRSRVPSLEYNFISKIRRQAGVTRSIGDFEWISAEQMALL